MKPIIKCTVFSRKEFVLGWSYIMDEKAAFGELSANELKIGDIVEWSKWSQEINDWEAYYGIIIEIKNEIKGNRMVSVSIVTPLNGATGELEFFTPSLKIISRGDSLRD
jgi:hypothetical protein